MPGLLRGIARTAVVAGTASAVAGGVAHRQQRRWATQEQDAGSEQQDTGNDQPVQSDPYDELEKLADLKAKGIITEEEFSAKKQQLLGL